MNRQMPLRREVVVLVAAGAVLGIVHNSIGLASRPPRGIPWLAVKAELPVLEDMAPTDSTATSGSIETPDAMNPPAPGPTSAAPPAAGAGETRRAPRGSSPSRPPGGASEDPAQAPPAGTAPPPPASDGMPEPRRAGPLPFIPDTDQPIQVQIGTVRKFFDAKAALFLDARDPAEYEKGHIPGAIRLTNPEAQNEPERLKALPVGGRPTIVYCEGGACEASLDLARFLLESGFKKVVVYMGGYPEWEAAGHPVAKGSAP